MKLEKGKDDDQRQDQDAAKDGSDIFVILRQCRGLPASQTPLPRAVVSLVCQPATAENLDVINDAIIRAGAEFEGAFHGCWMSASSHPIAAAAMVMRIAGFMGEKD